MIQDHHRERFRQILDAARRGDLGLFECTDAATGATVVTLSTIEMLENGMRLIPVARIVDGDPYQQFIPPLLAEDEVPA